MSFVRIALLGHSATSRGPRTRPRGTTKKTIQSKQAKHFPDRFTHVVEDEIGAGRLGHPFKFKAHAKSGDRHGVDLGQIKFESLHGLATISHDGSDRGGQSGSVPVGQSRP